MRDTKVRGLILRMTPAGVATWSVRARTREGKQTRPKLGTWPTMGIADARKRAAATLVDIRSGGDPVLEKRQAKAARAARAAEPTVAARLEEWRAARASSWSQRYALEVSRVCKREILPELGSRLLSDTTRTDGTGLISEKHRKSASVGSLLYRTASSFLNHAEAHGWVPLPLLPRRGASIIAPPVASRERVLTDDELAAVWRAADREAPKLRAFVRLLILTAARGGEVAGIVAGEIDGAVGRWTIPAARAKNKQGITISLGPLRSIELQGVWPNEEAASSRHLLGRTGATPFAGSSSLKDRIDRASGVTGWRWHDLRRTARTGLTRLGVPQDHAEAAVNHKSGKTALVRTYDRHRYPSEIIAALERWQAHVAELVA